MSIFQKKLSLTYECHPFRLILGCQFDREYNWSSSPFTASAGSSVAGNTVVEDESLFAFTETTTSATEGYLTTTAAAEPTCRDKFDAAPSGCSSGSNLGCCSGKCYHKGGNRGLCK